MENKLYIVSFGDSEKYRINYSGTKEELQKSPIMQHIENTIEKYIKGKVPEGSEAKLYVKPYISEISKENESEFASYPELDEASLPEIEKVLLNEVEDMLSLKCLNKNAPFDDI